MATETSASKGNLHWLTSMPFVKLFGGFKSAAQFSKMALGLVGIVVFCFVGWCLDVCTPRSLNVTVNAAARTADSAVPRTDLEAFVYADGMNTDDFIAGRRRIQESNYQLLLSHLTGAPLNMAEDNARYMIESRRIVGHIEDNYKTLFSYTADEVSNAYKKRHQALNEQVEMADTPVQSQQALAKLNRLDESYRIVFAAMVGEKLWAQPPGMRIKDLLADDGVGLAATRRQTNDKAIELQKRIEKTIAWAYAYRIADDCQGRGVFHTLIDFYSQCFHKGMLAIVRDHDAKLAGDQLLYYCESLLWVFRFHPIYAMILTLCFLVVWSVIGGAICRITALQVARDERIGAVKALQFSAAKMWSFICSPLIPIAIVVGVGLVITVINLVFGLIPFVGEIIVAVLMGAMLLIGFFLAFMIVGFIGGINLMYPAIAVEGSDCFDALSRSYTYALQRPWHLIFYNIVAAIYGALCYIFVRFYAFLVLLATHFFVGLLWPRNSAHMSITSKLDAMWATPAFDNLHKAINWLALSGSEAVGAFIILLWVAVIIALVIAFVVSFFFSINTLIYFLLRKKVDATSMEEVFVVEDMNVLVTPETSPENDTNDLQAESASTSSTNAAVTSTSSQTDDASNAGAISDSVTQQDTSFGNSSDDGAADNADDGDDLNVDTDIDTDARHPADTDDGPHEKSNDDTDRDKPIY